MAHNRFQEPMQSLYLAHRHFKQAWNQRQRVQAKNNKPAEVDIARDKFWEALYVVFQTKLFPLRQAFLSNSKNVIDDVIDFLSVDIPAFRCGYEKEWYLRQLKSVPLNEAQAARLKTIALDLCRKPDYKREFSNWTRLMIVLADEAFVQELSKLVDVPNAFAQKKAKRMLNIILRHRKDLAAKSVLGL